MDILILIALILLNGVFAMSEIALVTAKQSRLARRAADGDRAAGVALRLGDDPTRFLSTIQIGITAIGILNGIMGESALAVPFAAWLQHAGLDPDVSRPVATALVVALITYVSIVIGELVPKRVAQLNAEGIATRVARPISMLSVISRPFVYLLSLSTNAVLKLSGVRDKGAATVTEEDIHALVAEGSEAGVIEKHEHDMVRNVFRLDDRQIGSLMIPRGDIVYLDVALPLEANLQRVVESHHSRFPVCRDGLHDILGIIAAKQLFVQLHSSGTIDLTAQLQPCVYVPESLTGMELLDQFRASDTQIALVIDEYGEIEGLVTLQDVLEAVTGEFKPLAGEESWAVQREDGSWLLDGLIPIPELKDHLHLKAVPKQGKARYHTLSGLIMSLLGRLPRTGDVTQWEGWRLEVVDLDGKRIDKVLASRLPEPVGGEDYPECH